MTVRTTTRAALGIGLVMLVPTRALAEPSTSDRALATVLFEEGRALLAGGKPAEACPRFERAQKLDPSGGTLLNLALCHEQEGKLASAWAEFNEALSIAVRDGRRDRASAAEEHLESLRARLSRVRVSVSAAARTPGLRVSLDGRELPSEAIDVGVPVDPGEHVVEATAPGRAPFRSTVRAMGPGELPVLVTPLEADRGAPPTAPPPATRGGASTRTWVLGGVVVVAGGLAGGAAILARQARSDALDACPDKMGCDASAVDRNRTAVRLADAATVLTSLAAVSAGALVWSILDDRTQIAASAGPGRLDLRATLRFR